MKKVKSNFEFNDNSENMEFIKVLDDIIYDEMVNIETMIDVGIDIDIIKKHKYKLNKYKKIRNKLFLKSCKNFINDLFRKK